MSQEEFAERINTSVRFVHRLEEGLEEPRAFALIACASALKLSAEELLKRARMECAPLPAFCDFPDDIQRGS